MKKSQNETIERSVKALSRLISNVGGFQTRSETERLKNLEKQVLQMRRMYDILMDLPPERIRKLQTHAVVDNYNEGVGRIRLYTESFLPKFVYKNEK